MKDLGRLSETELEVMQTIWELAAPVTVAQLLCIFKERKNWKTSTLSTILARLIEKGFLLKYMKGKVNYYDTMLTLAEYRVYETKSFLNTVHNGSVKNFMSALVDDENLTKSEIADLKEWFQSKVGDM